MYPWALTVALSVATKAMDGVFNFWVFQAGEAVFRFTWVTIRENPRLCSGWRELYAGCDLVLARCIQEAGRSLLEASRRNGNR